MADEWEDLLQYHADIQAKKYEWHQFIYKSFEEQFERLQGHARGCAARQYELELELNEANEDTKPNLRLKLEAEYAHEKEIEKEQDDLYKVMQQKLQDYKATPERVAEMNAIKIRVYKQWQQELDQKLAALN